MSWDALDPTILGPAFLAGLLVVATHIPLGRRVLARGIIFLDLAVAQVAGLGLIAAHSLHADLHGWQVQLVAGSAALTGALALHWTERRWPEVQEALIGSLFVVASSLGIILLASDPHGGEQLRELLVGQILWVTYDQLLPVLLLYIPLLAIFYWRRESTLVFYLVFAAAVTASVQLVGVYLVFATLILPALAVRSRGGLPRAYAVGATGYGLGLALSALADLPAGAVVVCTLAALAMIWAWMPGKRR
jgi:zinc/manganese transport system permease protein